jgi:hypothetical protein
MDTDPLAGEPIEDPDPPPSEAQAEAEALAEEDIARRAYEISQSEEGGTAEENWRRAEAELRRR